MLGLALELEGTMDNDSSHSPRTQARAKWGQGPQPLDAGLEQAARARIPSKPSE
jgi:hypothetical protein